MITIDDFLQEVLQINWFEHCKDKENKYYVIHSVFEAYDVWNEQMLKTWEPHIFTLEKMAVNQIGDTKIDEIFSNISAKIEDILWQKWSNFIFRWNLEEESSLSAEMLDMVKRDISWVYIEKVLNAQGFFNTLFKIYKDGYFPCAWIGNYPKGQAVVL